MKTYTFWMQATVQLRLTAPDVDTAREIADEWQAHANGWEEFATVDDPDECFDTPANVRLLDATAYVDLTDIVLKSETPAEEE